MLIMNREYAYEKQIFIFFLKLVRVTGKRLNPEVTVRVGEDGIFVVLVLIGFVLC